MCGNIRIKFLLWTYMYTTIKFLGNNVIQTNPSKFAERLFSDIYLCRLQLKQGREYRILYFEAGEFQRDVPAKDMFDQVKPWPWHVEVIPRVSVVGLVPNEELCQVVWELLLGTLCMNTPLL